MRVINLRSYFQKKQLATQSDMSDVIYDDADTELSAHNIGFVLHGCMAGDSGEKAQSSVNLDEYEQAMVA